MSAESKNPWEVTLDLMERCGVMPPGGITPENLTQTLIDLAAWYARIAASLGATVGEPFDVTGTSDGPADHRDVVIGVVTLHHDGDASVIFPDGTSVVVAAAV